MSDIAFARVCCIAIAGDQARGFAQAQFSGDVAALSPGHWQWNAWLDARGRVQALMQLCDPGDGSLWAVLRGGDGPRVRDGLLRYVLRTRATLTVREFTGYAGKPMTMGTAQVIGPDVVMGCGGRSLRLGESCQGTGVVASDRWRLDDIRDGWPTLPADAPAFLPPALGLERLDALSFAKGCYPGQEIAARLHYLGGHKLRLHHVRGAAQPARRRPQKSIDPVAPVVLDSVSIDGITEALVVAPRTDTGKIISMGIEYDVISIFEP